MEEQSPSKRSGKKTQSKTSYFSFIFIPKTPLPFCAKKKKKKKIREWKGSPEDKATA